MNAPNDSLLAYASSHFRGKRDFEVEPIEKGGSGRKYFRIRASGAGSLIAVRYTSERTENAHYVAIARFLAESGVRVPAIFHHDPEAGMIFMEDLGEVDLWHWRGASWEQRRELYRAAIRQAVRLHGEATRRFPASGLALEKEFSEQLYLWEQEYFTRHCLAGIFGVPEPEARELVASAGLGEAARFLAALPRTLVHRDLQSQNVLIHRGEACLIDFQGMRPGLPHYDLASLLYDPYVTLEASEREELTGIYLIEAASAGINPGADFHRTFQLCAVQRLMQAMGAYGFLGLHEGRRAFLDHVEPARRSLRSLLSDLGTGTPLVKFLDSVSR